MLSVYQNCNIVTLPSFGEGLPTVLIEAAACERTIVTTDVPGCRDVVVHGVNGLLVPPNQPEALAQAIETLIREPEQRFRMGKAGRQRVLEKFTVEQVNVETYKVYTQILKNGHSI
jgi:glycosyltransferase involved in cell wall biosynthesis